MKTPYACSDFATRAGVVGAAFLATCAAWGNPISLPQKPIAPEIAFLIGSAILLEVACVWFVLRRWGKPRFFVLWLIGMHRCVDVSWIPGIAGRIGLSAAGFGSANWRVSGCLGGGSHNLSLVPAPPCAEIGAFGSVGAQMLAGVARRQHLFRGGFPNPERAF